MTDLSSQDHADQLASLQAIEASVANRFATGQLQQEFQDALNVTVGELGIQAPASAGQIKPLAKVASVLVVREADGCAAQTPCRVQPVLRVVDENVSSFGCVIVQSVQRVLIFFLFRIRDLF